MQREESVQAPGMVEEPSPVTPPMDDKMTVPIASPGRQTLSPGRARLVKKHPLAIRWFHWINFPVLMLMIWSGILILWAYDSYPTEKYALKVPNRISFYRWGVTPVYADQDKPDFPVPELDKPAVFVSGAGAGSQEAVPKDVKDKPSGPVGNAGRYDITLGFRLAEGMAWHFALAWLFTLNGLAYLLFLGFSGEWRHILPRRESFRESFRVVLHDLHLYKGPLPPGKYNHAQRIAYTGVLILGALMIATGLAIYKPAQLNWLADLFGGYQSARTIHFLVTVLLVLFFLVHIAQVVRTGWNNFRGMITGYEVSRAPMTAAEEGQKP
jgi:thiosulfate reductase cytochrome b subunit